MFQPAWYFERRHATRLLLLLDKIPLIAFFSWPKLSFRQGRIRENLLPILPFFFEDRKCFQSECVDMQSRDSTVALCPWENSSESFPNSFRTATVVKSWVRIYASRKRLRYCYFVCICASVISGISNCAQFVHKNVNTRAFCRHTTHAHAEGLNDSEKMLTIILVSASKGVGVSIRKVV